MDVDTLFAALEIKSVYVDKFTIQLCVVYGAFENICVGLVVIVETVTCFVSGSNVKDPSARMSARTNGETKRSKPIHFIIEILFMRAWPAGQAVEHSRLVIVVSVQAVAVLVAAASDPAVVA